MKYKIQLLWDNDASVWIATTPDVPGLVLESRSLDALIKRVKHAIPELVELNKQKEPFRKLKEEDFFLKVDEGIADVEAGKYLISESVEAELAAEFGLANK